MTVSELDTLYFKFKNLVLAEKNATLTLKSEAGRTDVTLTVDLGHLLADAGPQQPYHGRNGPARRRRRERRAAARQEAEEASKREENAKTDATNETKLLLMSRMKRLPRMQLQSLN